MKNIKLIITDLDDTLLRRDKTISGRTISALSKCRQKGIKTAYATGRGGTSTTLVPSDLFDGYIRMNGATAHAGDELVYDKKMPAKTIKKVLLAVHNAGAKAAVESNGMHYSNFNVTAQWDIIKNYKIIDFNKIDFDAAKIYIIIENQKTIDIINANISEEMYFYNSRDNLAMVTHKDAIKSKGVAALMNYWGINKSEVIAFGDDTNDIDLLQICGTGVAMGNALDEVKAVANQICDTNNNDGIAKWIEDNVI